MEFLSSLTIFDLIAVTIIGICLVIGLFRGAIDEIFSLIGWVIAFILANTFAKDIADAMSGVIHKSEVRIIVAYLILFIGTLVAVSLIKLMLSELMRAIGLGSVDKILGGVVGCAKGMVIVLIIVTTCAMLTSLPKQKSWKHSVSAKWFESMAMAAKPWLPDGLAKKINFRSSMKA